MTAAPARLQLRRTDHKQTGNPYVDGGWWPHSRDLGAELGALLAGARDAGLATRRVLFRIEEWTPAPPRRMTIDGQTVKLGGYRNQTASTVSLVDDSGRTLDLVVVSPDSTDDAAAATMQRASRDGDPATAAEVLLPTPAATQVPA